MTLLKRVQDAINKPGVSAKLKGVLQQVGSYDNVPRKKAKFQVGAFFYLPHCDEQLGLPALTNSYFFFCSELDEKQP